MSAAVIIPARYGSTRFPGKPLMRGPDGKSLIQYVWDAARATTEADDVIIATDDARIAEAARAFGADVRMTGSAHNSGSDRCAELAASMTHEVIVNLQGDEPNMPPEIIAQAIRMLQEDPEADIATLANVIETVEELHDPGVVKVVLDDNGYALYFSRASIPHVRDSVAPLRDSPAAFLRHHGIYAYRRDALIAFSRLPPHPLEQAEKLEQLRALAHGYKIKVAVTSHRPLKVDTREDFEAFYRWKSAR